MARGTGAQLKKEEMSPEQIRKRLDTMDQRLDAIDTMVTTIAERMMKRPISVEFTCPNCGRIIDIAVVGNERMMR